MGKMLELEYRNAKLLQINCLMIQFKLPTWNKKMISRNIGKMLELDCKSAELKLLNYLMT